VIQKAVSKIKTTLTVIKASLTIFLIVEILHVGIIPNVNFSQIVGRTICK
jgi:hypothetical protein